MSVEAGGSDGRLDAARRARLSHELTRFSRNSRVRGEAYARGRVVALEADESGISAQVRGTDLYEVRWDWLDGAWEATCSCPVGWDCKHCYAVGAVVLRAHSSTGTAVARPAPSPFSTPPFSSPIAPAPPARPPLR